MGTVSLPFLSAMTGIKTATVIVGCLAEEAEVLLDSLQEVRFRADPPRRSVTLAKTRRINGGSHCADLDKMELQETVYVKDQSTRECGMF